MFNWAARGLPDDGGNWRWHGRRIDDFRRPAGAVYRLDKVAGRNTGNWRMVASVSSHWGFPFYHLGESFNALHVDGHVGSYSAAGPELERVLEDPIEPLP